MVSGENGITFEEADRRYAELKRARESGTLSDEEFATRLHGLMVQDDRDRWWVKSPRSGDWHRHDGKQWIKDTPPEPYKPPQTTDSTADLRSQTASVETPPPGSTVRRVDAQQRDDRPPPIGTQPPPAQTVRPVGVADGGRQDRGVSRKLLVVGGLVVVVVLGLVGLLAIAAVLGTRGPTAPNLVGQTESEAERSVGNDYDIYVSGEKVDDAPKGTIISQDPAADQEIKGDRTISVVVSAGKPPKPGDIFKDDFSDTSSGWYTGSGSGDNAWVIEYALGGYRFYNPAPPTTSLGLNPDAGTGIRDAIIEVDATPASGDLPEKEGTGWGIVCRAADYNTYYAMGILVDGRPTIWKAQNATEGKWVELATGRSNDAIKHGNTTNHLRADCVGDKLTLYVNGWKVAEAQDSELKTGQVGLFAWDDGQALDVIFDDLAVSSP